MITELSLTLEPYAATQINQHSPTYYYKVNNEETSIFIMKPAAVGFR